MVNILFEDMQDMVEPKHQVSHLTNGNLCFFTSSLKDNNGVYARGSKKISINWVCGGLVCHTVLRGGFFSHDYK